MAEIFATATAAAGFLEQAIKLFARIRNAIERQKALPELVDKYSAEVTQTKNIVELIEDEEALKTPNVGKAISRVGTVGEALRNHLIQIATTKGPVQDFFHQLVSGKKGEDKLDSIMKDLESAKMNLSIYIQLSHVGLIKGVGEAVQVSINEVAAINKLLIERLGSGHELRISQVLEGKPRNADGTVTLTEEDIVLLAEPLPGLENDDISGQAKSKLIARDNTASNYALQVNTPIGSNIWEGADITAERNTATGNATQFNAPTSDAAFLAALEARKVPSVTAGDVLQ